MDINKIINGDCYKEVSKMPDNSIDLVYIDIPYLYGIGGAGTSDIANRIKKTKKELTDISNGIDFSIFNELMRVMKKVNIFIWCSKLQIRDLLNYFEKYNFELLIWAKPNPIPNGNNTWLSDLEYCLYFREKGVKLNDGYDLKKKYYVKPINKYDKDKYGHPTIKPLDIVKQHIKHATQENDIILDCFCGSGTTCVAARETKRNYIGIEINKSYYDMAVNRINGIDASGQTSILFED